MTASDKVSFLEKEKKGKKLSFDTSFADTFRGACYIYATNEDVNDHIFYREYRSANHWTNLSKYPYYEVKLIQ